MKVENTDEYKMNRKKELEDLHLDIETLKSMIGLSGHSNSLSICREKNLIRAIIGYELLTGEKCKVPSNTSDIPTSQHEENVSIKIDKSKKKIIKKEEVSETKEVEDLSKKDESNQVVTDESDKKKVKRNQKSHCYSSHKFKKAKKGNIPGEDMNKYAEDESRNRKSKKSSNIAKDKQLKFPLKEKVLVPIKGGLGNLMIEFSKGTKKKDFKRRLKIAEARFK